MQEIARIDLLNGILLNATPIDFNSKVTTTEWLLEIQSKINGIVDQINGWTKESIEYTDECLKLERETVNKQLDELMEEVNKQYSLLLQKLLTEISNVNTQHYTDRKDQYDLITSEYLANDKKILDYINDELEEIRFFIKDYNMGVYDPTTGYYNTIGSTISNLFDFFRSNAMNVTQLDARTTTAKERDDEHKSAKELDCGQTGEGTADLSVVNSQITNLVNKTTPEQHNLSTIASKVTISDGGYDILGSQVIVDITVMAQESGIGLNNVLTGLPKPKYGKRGLLAQTETDVLPCVVDATGNIGINGYRKNDIIYITGNYIEL